MSLKSSLKKTVFAMLLASGITGCSVISPSQPTQYYVLSADAQASSTAGAYSLPDNVQVGIGPTDIPGYADRPQIVTLGANNKLTVADFDHWAEPVQNNVARILVDNVSALISNRQVYSYPANFHPLPDSMQVSVEIREMIQTADGTARLTASWNVKRMLDNKLLTRETRSFQRQTVAGDYASYASGMSGLLSELSAEMAKSLVLANGMNKPS